MAEDWAEVGISQLVDEYYQAVYRYAYRLCGNLADAEDLTQKAFLVAHGSLNRLRNAEKARSWLFTILRNLFLRDYRQQRPRTETDLALNFSQLPLAIPAVEEVDSGGLQDALTQLPEIARLMLVMFYFEELSYREIAERLELPLGTVMSRLARAKAVLRSKLLDGIPRKRKITV
ncbi:MAG: RNA polymerase sigma factor [Pirellulales bacterium]|nr:RNA polymerase sigma factor [Pirellulales bacterium]